MYSISNTRETSKVDASLVYLDAAKPVDSLLAVIEAAIAKRAQLVMFERNTAKRLLRDYIADGYDLYLLALAFEYLVENTEGPIFAGKLCSVPALIAGLSALDVTPAQARYEYWYRFVKDKKSYMFWFYRYQDAVEGGAGYMEVEAKKRMTRLLEESLCNAVS